jgi:hypothetical protein
MRNDTPDTASLIDGLAASLSPVSRRRPSREAAILTAILGLQLIGTLLFISSSSAAVFTHNPAMALAKTGIFAALTVSFAVLAFRSFEPTAPRQRSLALSIGAVVTGFAVLTLDRNFGGSASSILMPSKGITCLVSALSFSLPMFIGLTFFMRGGAPTQPKATALFIGVASGAWGAFIYGLQCPFMNIGYVALWYGGAVAVSTLAAAIILPRIARW